MAEGRALLRVAATAVAAACAFAIPASSAAASPEPIALVQHGHTLTRAELKQGAAVLTYQVNHQLRRFWPVPAVVVTPRRKPPPSWLRVELVTTKPPSLTAGYHATDADGQPVAVVYLRRWRTDWTVGASHELLEMLIDPDGETISSPYLEEVCDPVQFIWYRLHGVYVADFTTPAWFSGASGPWDIGHRLRGPYSYGRGGEEEYHDAQDQWIFVGPGAQLHKLPKPLKLKRLSQS